MPVSWALAAIVISLLASVLERFVQAQRRTEAGALDRFYLHTLRHSLQAVREWGWNGVAIVLWAAFHIGIYLILIVGLVVGLLVSLSTSFLLPGCF